MIDSNMLAAKFDGTNRQCDVSDVDVSRDGNHAGYSLDDVHDAWLRDPGGLSDDQKQVYIKYYTLRDDDHKTADDQFLGLMGQCERVGARHMSVNDLAALHLNEPLLVKHNISDLKRAEIFTYFYDKLMDQRSRAWSRDLKSSWARDYDASLQKAIATYNHYNNPFDKLVSKLASTRFGHKLSDKFPRAAALSDLRRQIAKSYVTSAQRCQQMNEEAHRMFRNRGNTLGDDLPQARGTNVWARVLNSATAKVQTHFRP